MNWRHLDRVQSEVGRSGDGWGLLPHPLPWNLGGGWGGGMGGGANIGMLITKHLACKSCNAQYLGDFNYSF